MILSRMHVLATAALLMTACEGATPTVAELAAPVALAPAGQTKTNVREPVVGATVNPCNGETIEVSGYFHIVTTTTTTATGTTTKVHLNTAAVQGVGLDTGAKYNFIAKQSVFTVESTDGTFSQDAVTRIKNVSQGTTENSTDEQVFHVTWDGTDYTVVTETESRCNG
jgi:hypothetical protein